MKKVILFFVAAMLIPSLSNASYSDEYQDGYKEGYTYNPNGGIKDIPPIPPIAPIPNIGDSEQDAYARGIIDGQNAKQEGDY